MREGDGGVEEDDEVVGVDRRHDGSPGGRSDAAGREGESPPPSSSSLASPLDGRRVSPLVLDLHGSGGAGAPLRLDLSLFCAPVFWPFTVSYIPGDL